MAMIRCKMCGADLQIVPGTTVCECEYCGSKQTVPNADDEKKVKLFERANRLRLNCEFDKAASVYENIISEFSEEAEAYWGLILCKYGIEYVDDPADGRKVPTCHRSSFESVMEDPDFELVLEYADSVAKRVYREQAKEFEEIRKGIIEVSGKEKPYDIFICYKETDENGERTLDSVLAQDVYDALTAKGYRVFFSRISLEDKLGVEYEPYIFAALNSAKVMLAFGTAYEYYDAVWVKNEWSRFLKLMEKDKSRHLIPCYKNLDAYDMPKEFAKLQAQDLGKVGAVQDLLRGIDKLTTAHAAVQSVVTGGPNMDALFERGFMALEDNLWQEADQCFDQILTMNAKHAKAWLGKLMAENHQPDIDAMGRAFVAGDLCENRNYRRAKQFSDTEFLSIFSQWEEWRAVRLKKDQQVKEEAEKRAQEEARAAEERAREAARKANAEADRKAREAEAERKAKEETIRGLLAQLSTGNFEMPAGEQAELQRLTDQIASKRTQLAGLGFLKMKEKKNLQEQIAVLENTLADKKAKARESVRSRIFNLLGLDFSKDSVKFGSYEQGSGIQPIEWRVLERSDQGILLITRYGIDCRRYHKTKTDITWEKCDLRKWLNNDFLNMAFSETERSLIADTRCPADKNPEHNTYPGNDTTDKIFLLSIPEVNKYFKSDADRKAAPTAYAKKHGAYTSDNYKTAAGEACCWWWLRSPGNLSDCAAYVRYDGSVYYFGYYVNLDADCVRPALWINL